MFVILRTTNNAYDGEQSIYTATGTDSPFCQSAGTLGNKGIELKRHREKRSSKKHVLFTQTPDWDISALKSGREIVAKYGYLTDDGKKTYQNTAQC